MALRRVVIAILIACCGAGSSLGDPKAEIVIARFASHPLASYLHLDPVTLPAFHALGAASDRPSRWTMRP